MEAANHALKVIFPQYTDLTSKPSLQTHDEVERFILEEMPEKIEMVRKLQLTYNAFLTQYTNLILKRPQQTNLIHSLLLKVTQKTDRYFNSMELEVKKLDKTTICQEYYQMNLIDMRRKLKDRLFSLEGQVDQKYFSKFGMSQDLEEEIAVRLYTIFEIYHFTKTDMVTAASKYRVNQSNVLEAISAKQLQVQSMPQLIKLDSDFIQHIHQTIYTRCKPFINKREFLQMKYKELMKEGQIKFQQNFGMLFDSLLTKEKYRVNRKIITMLDKELKNVDPKTSEQQECKHIIKEVEEIKKNYIKLKNTSYFIDIMKGSFSEKYKMQVNKISNLYYLSNLEKYFKDVSDFLRRVLDLQEKIIHNRRNFMRNFGDIVQFHINDTIGIFQDKTIMRKHLEQLIDEELNALESALNGSLVKKEPLKDERHSNNYRSIKMNEAEQRRAKYERERGEKQMKRKNELEKRRQEDRKKRQEQKMKMEEKRKIDEQRLQKLKEERQQKEKRRKEEDEIIQMKKIEQMKKRQEQRKKREQQEKQKRQVERKRKQEQKSKLEQADRMKRQKLRKEKEQQQKIMKEQAAKRKAEEQQKRKKQAEHRKQQERKKIEQENRKKQQLLTEKRQKQQQEKKRKEEQRQKKIQQEKEKERLKKLELQKKQKQVKQRKQKEEKQRRQRQQKLQKEKQEKLKRQKEQKEKKEKQERQKKQKLEREKKEKEQRDKKQRQQRERKQKQKKQAEQRKRKQQLQKKKRQQEEKKKQEQQRKRKQEQENKRQQEQRRRKQQQDRKKKQQQRKRKEQQEKKRKQQQRKRKEEQQRMKKEQQKKKKEEEEKRRLQEEARIKKEQQLKKKKLQEERKQKQRLQMEKKKKKNEPQKPKGGSGMNYDDLDDLIDDDDFEDKIKKSTKKEGKKDQYQIQLDDQDYDDEAFDDYDEKQEQIETKELIDFENLKCLNDYMKGTQYARKNKPNLQPFNNSEQYLYLFEEFIDNQKLFIFKSTISKAIWNFAHQLQDENSNQDDLRITVETIQEEIHNAYEAHGSLKMIHPQTKLIFPFSFANDLSIQIVEVVLLQRSIRVIFGKEISPNEGVQQKYACLIEAFTHVFGIEGEPEDFHFCLSEESKMVIDSFDKELPNLLVLFAMHYEHNFVNQININQYTVDRFFYTSHVLEPFYKIIQEEDEGIIGFYQQMTEKFSENKKVSINIIQVQAGEQNYEQILMESSLKQKQNFLAEGPDTLLVMYQILVPLDESGEEFDKFIIYTQMSKGKGKPVLNYFIVSRDEEEQENASKMFEMISSDFDDSNFQTTVYIDYTRHNGVYEYADWTLPLWAHMITKRKMAPTHAFRALTLSMAPYYVAYRQMD